MDWIDLDQERDQWVNLTMLFFLETKFSNLMRNGGSNKSAIKLSEILISLSVAPWHAVLLHN
jgi:hypothetical protein